MLLYVLLLCTPIVPFLLCYSGMKFILTKLLSSQLHWCSIINFTELLVELTQYIGVEGEDSCDNKILFISDHHTKDEKYSVKLYYVVSCIGKGLYKSSLLSLIIP